LPPASYTSGASIYSCFFERPVVVNLAVSTEEKLKLENEKVKIRKKGGCCCVHNTCGLFAPPP